MAAGWSLVEAAALRTVFLRSQGSNRPAILARWPRSMNWIQRSTTECERLPKQIPLCIKSLHPTAYLKSGDPSLPTLASYAYTMRAYVNYQGFDIVAALATPPRSALKYEVAFLSQSTSEGFTPPPPPPPVLNTGLIAGTRGGCRLLRAFLIDTSPEGGIPRDPPKSLPRWQKGSSVQRKYLKPLGYQVVQIRRLGPALLSWDNLMNTSAPTPIKSPYSISIVWAKPIKIINGSDSTIVKPPFADVRGPLSGKSGSVGTSIVTSDNLSLLPSSSTLGVAGTSILGVQKVEEAKKPGGEVEDI
ncbi:hypothetical protein M427DRAFT_43483 [Gonapodya prolifera JEL478]|uniref:Uncharacterized protein n=1 Tax=Gonapodya prolifera (strain JEL478) TaxID=1344416 RepID=A0A139AJW1_GONPJ|nr:hypothetical protein M427DRAFT_43483 [Gonapodya prolifera JEL478]|eukprot:KXS16695.1 hypothetical protein M427DRAFT_43483 [Gonapodya prolifera JEL478]